MPAFLCTPKVTLIATVSLNGLQVFNSGVFDHGKVWARITRRNATFTDLKTMTRRVGPSLSFVESVEWLHQMKQQPITCNFIGSAEVNTELLRRGWVQKLEMLWCPILQGSLNHSHLCLPLKFPNHPRLSLRLVRWKIIQGLAWGSYAMASIEKEEKYI